MKVTEDPELFLAIEDLELAGGGIADSVWLGAHRSIHRGPGVEFESHREYQPGDDLRRIDWSVFARQRKLFTRESRIDSLRPVYLLVDSSGSMSVSHGRYSKFDYASRVAAAIAFLASRQGDHPAVGLLGKRLEDAIAPRSGLRHVLEICASLIRTKPEGEGELAAALADCHGFCRKRGFLVVISDFLESEEGALSELAAFHASGHDVLGLQVLDPFEVELPESGDYEFVEVETDSRFRTSTEPFRHSHAEAVAAWREKLAYQAALRNLRWDSVTTNDSLVETARRWLEMATDLAGARSGASS